jgi:hypothetical protein
MLEKYNQIELTLLFLTDHMVYATLYSSELMSTLKTYYLRDDHWSNLNP